MKILHIIDSGGLYGAEMVLLNLVAEQIKMGLDPCIASIGDKHIGEKPLETEARKRGFRVVKFRMFPGPNPYGMLKVLRYAKQNEFDILHSHGYKGNVAFGLMPKRIRKIPMISTLHGWTSVSGFSKNRVYEWLDLISLKYIDAVVLVSEAMKSHPKLEGRKGINFHVIHNGIPIPAAQFNHLTIQPFNQSRIQATSTPPAQWNESVFNIPSGLNSKTIQPGQSTQSTQQTRVTQATQRTQKLDQSIVDFCKKGYTIGSIGRLSTEKGYKYLIEALTILIKKGIDARLVIMGEGYERPCLENLTRELGLSEKVLLPGYIDEANLYIPLFDVFVISSLTEGLPITLLEAMQAKTPIVGSRVGGIPYLLDESRAGLLVNPASPDAIANAVFRIYDDGRLAKALVDDAYERVYTDFGMEGMALAYLEVYKRVAGR